MDDFKIILYVVAALGWMFFKNYEKIKQEAAKRNLSKPAVPESAPLPTSNPQPEPTRKQLVKPVIKKVLPKPAMAMKDAMRKPLVKATTHSKPKETVSIEGGLVQPSAMVHFVEEEDVATTWQNPIVEQLRNADFRQAVILSEVLQRPNY